MNTAIDYSLLKGQKLKSALIEILNHDDWENHVCDLIKIHGFKLTNSFFSASYNESALISNRAISCFGLLVKNTEKSQTEKIRILMRKCIWMLTEESGGIPWKIPEIMGEIISVNKQIAGEYSNILFSYINETPDGYDNFLDNTALRKSVFKAIIKISRSYPEMILNYKDIIQQRVNAETEPEIIAALHIITSNAKFQFKN